MATNVRAVKALAITGIVLAIAATPLTSLSTVLAGSASTVTVTSARQITNVVDDPNAWVATLSPSGAMLAHYAESGRGRDRAANLCVYTFESAGKACHQLPETFSLYPYQLAWSPDESAIAFSENPVELAYESDIWLFNVASGTTTNLTDDGVTGSWSAQDTAPELDYLPFWDPDGSILFWRLVPHGDLTFDLGIYRMPAGGGSPELVADVGAQAPAMLPVFGQERFFLDGPSSLSPDGSTVAALLTGFDAVGMAHASLWFVDLSADPVTIAQVASPDVFSAAVPDWETFPTETLGVSWTGDGAGVVTFSTVNDIHAPFTVLHYVDATTGTTTPVVDFSTVDSYEGQYAIPPGGQLPWRVYSPWSAVLSPGSDEVLMVNDLSGVTGLMAATLPPDGTFPEVVAAAESSVYSTASRSSRSEDGKVTVYGLLLAIDEE